MTASHRENAKLKLRIGRAWSQHFGPALRTHQEIANELGISKNAVKQAEASGTFRFFALLTEFCDGLLPEARQDHHNRASGWQRKAA